MKLRQPLKMYFWGFLCTVCLPSLLLSEEFKVKAPLMPSLMETNELKTPPNVEESIVSPSEGLSSEKLHQLPSSLPFSMDSLMEHSIEEPRGMSYMTRSPVSQNDSLLTLPLSSVISLDTLQHSALAPFFQQHSNMSESSQLALFLLHEKCKGEKSSWYFYIKEMPEIPPNFIFLSPSLNELLKGSYFTRLIGSRIRAIEGFLEQYEDALLSDDEHEAYFTLDELTLESLAWAMGTVWSRMLLLHETDSQSTSEPSVSKPFLIPIVDTFPFCTNCSTQIYFDGNSMHLMATKNYQQHEQIQLASPLIGDFSSLLNYGIFTEPKELIDYIPFHLAIDGGDQNIARKKQIAKSLNISLDTHYRLRYKAHDAVNADTLQSMRLKLLNHHEIQEYENKGKDGMISIRNEFAICRSLHQAFTLLRREYPTTIEEDRAKLALPEVKLIEKNILQVIILEKELLDDALNDIKAYWDNLLSLEDVSALM